MTYTVTLGSDPELFLQDEHNNLVSSIGKIGGSKHDPLPLPEMPPGYFVQEDNVAVEFNIPPATNAKAFVDSIQRGLSKIEEIAKGLNLKACIEAAVVFPESELMAPGARHFGCTPDYNAWTNKMNPRPNATGSALRSAGGHIHVGIAPEVSKDDLRAIVCAMDLYLGVPSVLMDNNEDRRKLYGKAGAFRWTPYGMEYRVLSNFWIKTAELCHWAYNNTQLAIQRVLENKDRGWLEAERTRIWRAINLSDRDLASRLITDHKLHVS